MTTARNTAGIASRIRSIMEVMPAGGAVTFTRADFVDLLRFEPEAESEDLEPPHPAELRTPTWRELLWTVPAETRMGVLEVAESLGRPEGFVYRYTSAKGGKALLPHRKLDGRLLFTAGEIRAWIHDHEDVIAAGPTETHPREQRPLRLRAK